MSNTASSVSTATASPIPNSINSNAAALAITQSILENDDLRHALTDPISYEIMKNPVTAEDGFSYEKETIEAWIQNCRLGRRPVTSPMTNASMGPNLIPNRSLRSILQGLDRQQDERPRTVAARNVINCHSRAPAVAEQLSSQVFVELDRVMNLPAIKSLDLKVAQVVALGMESHGKSTLLERLIGLPLFPKDRQRCTICPIRVHLRRTETVQIAEVFIRDLRTKQELHKRSVAMDVICKAIEELMKTVLTLEPRNGIASNHEIVIRFSSPSMPNLDLLDLPGLVGSSCGAGSNTFAEQTYALAERVIREESGHSIFLLVVDVRAQVNHSRAAELVRVHGIESQTIGAFTKLDCYMSEDDSDDTLMQKVCGAELLTTHGWFGCSSRKPTLGPTMDREIDRLVTMTQSEKELLKRPVYRLGVQKNRLGIASLRGQVVALFEDFLCHTWIPNIVTQLKSEMDRLIGEHVGTCGLPIPRQNGKYDRVVAKLIVSVPRCVPDCDVGRLFQIADNERIINELNKSLEVLGSNFGDSMDLSGDGIAESMNKYEKLVQTSLSGEQNLLNAFGNAKKALEMCNNIVDRLCAKISSPTFVQQVATKLQHQDTYCKGQSWEGKRFFNIARFSEVNAEVRMQMQKNLQQVSDLVRTDLKSSLRDFASSADGGFIHSYYAGLVSSATPQNRTNGSHHGVYHQHYSNNNLTWNPSATRMHYRIVDMWFQAILTHLPTVLACPASLFERTSLQETCEAQRIEILKKLSKCADVSAKLLKIQADKPKLAYSNGTAKPRITISCKHGLSSFYAGNYHGAKCSGCSKTCEYGSIYYCSYCGYSSSGSTQCFCNECFEWLRRS